MDNKRLSEARRQPGMMCSDTSGSYTLTECGFTPTVSCYLCISNLYNTVVSRLELTSHMVVGTVLINTIDPG